MPHTKRTLGQRVAAAASLMLALAAPARAQQPVGPQPVAQPTGSPGVITRYDFHLSAASLAIDDKRFDWTTHFGGELDGIDYSVGRASIAVDYEAVLGHEFRAFDPNQGNYTLETSASARLGQTEAVFVFHHVSRHLSDRPKQFTIAWNTTGARVLRRFALDAGTLDLLAEAGRIVQHSYIDYTWIGNLEATYRRSIVPRASVFAHVSGQLVGVNSEIAGRTDQQRGGLVEGGVRINGRDGAIELFGGAERRIDADPIDRQPQQWAFAGFRLIRR